MERVAEGSVRIRMAEETLHLFSCREKRESEVSFWSQSSIGSVPLNPFFFSSLDYIKV